MLLPANSTTESTGLQTVLFEPLPTLTAVTQTFCAVPAAPRRRRCRLWPGSVGGGTAANALGVATGGSGWFAVTVFTSAPSTLIWTLSAALGWSPSVARPETRIAARSTVWRGTSSVTTGLLDGGGGGTFTQTPSSST